jgi:sirohydrochlorin cobaltochelatase
MPMFIAQGGHLKREVPEMLGRLRSTWPEVRFSLGEAIGENETVVQAMAAAALEAAGKILTKPPADFD